MIAARLDRVAWRRARRVVARLGPHLDGAARVLDVGSGTGHTASVIAARGVEVVATDIVDMHVTGPLPVRCDDGRLPFPDGSFDVAILVYVLQYVPDATALLRDVARVARRVVLIQSTFRGPIGRAYLSSRELVTGRLALRVAAGLRYVERGISALDHPRLITNGRLRTLVADAGLVVTHASPARALPVSRELLVLERPR